MSARTTLAATLLVGAGLLGPAFAQTQSNPGANSIVKSLTPTDGLSNSTRGIRIGHRTPPDRPRRRRPRGQAGGGQPEYPVRHRLRGADAAGDPLAGSTGPGALHPDARQLSFPHRGPHRHGWQRGPEQDAVATPGRGGGELSDQQVPDRSGSLAGRRHGRGRLAGLHSRQHAGSAQSPRAGGERRELRLSRRPGAALRPGYLPLGSAIPVSACQTRMTKASSLAPSPWAAAARNN